jgi:hypothetical protein
VVDGQNGTRYDHVVAQIRREEWAHRAVDHATGENGAFGRASLAPQKSAGYTPHGVQFFLEVNRQWKIVNAVAGTRGRRRGYEHRCFAVTNEYRGVGKFREFAGLKDERATRERGGVFLFPREISA